MRATELKAHGFDGLVQIDLPEPNAAADEIVIQIRAASVNFRDLAVVLGRHRCKLPVIPLSDGVGTIVSVGKEVRAFKPGQRVCPVFAPGWASGPPCETSTSRSLGGDTDGVLRDYMALKPRMPCSCRIILSDEEAATLLARL